jgi:hypothetical protein
VWVNRAEPCGKFVYMDDEAGRDYAVPLSAKIARCVRRVDGFASAWQSSEMLRVPLRQAQRRISARIMTLIGPTAIGL